MKRAFLAVAVFLMGCQRCADAPPAPPVADAPPGPPVAVNPAARIQAAEAAAMRDSERQKCANPVSIYSGSITVDATDYRHTVAKGDDYVEVDVEGLDKKISTATKVRFTLDYPFEKPFAGTITGKVTLRAAIDAIRAGFRKMYKGATIGDIPGMMNKDVKGPYGNAFHDIGDLVIEGIDLCDGDVLDISIGS